MKNASTIFLLLLLVAPGQLFAQRDSTGQFPKIGVDNSYTGMAYTESAVYGFQLTYTTLKHGFAIGPHIYNHDLFEGQDEWGRFGVAFTYQFFPIRSNRLFSPFAFYDLNYQYIRSSRNELIPLEDGTGSYLAVRQVTSNSIAHHFGIGVRSNFYRGLFAHLSLGAGVATYGNSTHLRSLQSSFQDVREPEHPFSNHELALMFRIGIAYQISWREWKQQDDCCN